MHNYKHIKFHHRNEKSLILMLRINALAELENKCDFVHARQLQML